MNSKGIDLPNRFRSPGYELIETDFTLLLQDQNDYAQYVEKSNNYTSEKYNEELSRLSKKLEVDGDISWKRNSIERDVEQLKMSYEKHSMELSIQENLIKFQFNKIHRCVDEIIDDHKVGYLSDNKMIQYLRLYKQVVEENELIGLKDWCTFPIGKIKQKIAEIESKR